MTEIRYDEPGDALAAWRAGGGESGPVLDPIARSAANPTSRTLAIRAKCYDCVGRGADPGWRWQIGNCDAACPLVPFRPYRHLFGSPAPAAIAGHATPAGSGEPTTTPAADRPRPPWED